MFKELLFRQVDNSALIVFRVCFGLLIVLESIGATLTGWVKITLIEPKFTFTFIGFEWLQPLPGNWMYVYFILMGIFGFFVMIGYRYRLSIISFTLMWTSVYLMQKTSYNNHYYLLMLLSVFMIFVPANRYLSFDVKRDPELRSIKMPQWCSWIFMLQIAMVYIYAAIAKLYPDWLNTTFIELLLENKTQYAIVGDLFQQKWFHYFIAYSGIIFDFLVVPLLLFKPTRKFAFFASIFFHIFNSFVFHIGIFPYLALAMCLFFFDSKTIQRIVLKRKPYYDKNEIMVPKHANLLVAVLVVYFCVQDLLPWRHWVIKDNVLWTEEGHRLSWRMMLRSKTGKASFSIIDKESNEKKVIRLSEYLTPKQRSHVSTKPDFIWQFAQYLKQEYAKKGKDISVFVNCKVSVNGKPFYQLIDPNIDLAAVKWNTFKHNEWILPSKL